MTRHLADVERWWFRGVFTAEVTDGNYESEDDPDLDWHHGPADTIAEARDIWHVEVARAREIAAACRPRRDRGVHLGQPRRDLAALDHDPHDRGVREPLRPRRLPARAHRRRDRRLTTDVPSAPRALRPPALRRDR